MRSFLRAPLVFVLIILSACAAPSIERHGSAYRITVPSDDCTIEFPAGGFKVAEADSSRPYYYLTNDKTKVNVSFNFDHAVKCNSSESCRNYVAKRMKAAYPNKKNWQSYKVGEVYVAENMDGALIGGFNPRLQHVDAHYVKEKLWLDVHLTKTDYTEQDRELLMSFIRSIKVTRKSN